MVSSISKNLGILDKFLFSTITEERILLLIYHSDELSRIELLNWWDKIGYWTWTPSDLKMHIYWHF